ncbi:MAG: sigma-70 family RNA polymerase sigma factor [Acidobacteria bacterium]|nr:sigma-70 family RNA polymerase sigma factor [Acidobacteriota bacterium]
MQPPGATDTTDLLVKWSKGDRQALQELMPRVYDELRRVADHLLRRERAAHTLQPTALVHEAYLRLVDQTRVDWHNRSHFLAVAAQMLRRVLVDHARAKQRLKRGSGTVVVSLQESLAPGPERNLDVVALDEALNALARLDPQQSRIVELRFFAGVSIEQTAASLGISPATVKRDWAVARAWLYRRLTH